jgi:glycosyltransferase involved in cell wall biosynthesis
VLIKDGPLTDELENILNEYIINYPKIFKIIALPVNKGLGNALSIGVLECSNELIARMDTDDICVPHRFERQIRFLEENPNIDVVGCTIEEFGETPGDLKRYRKMPETYDEILKYSKFRSPVNHATVIFKKSKILSSGNYNGNILFIEDFSLFIRMINSGSVFHNLQETLLHVRVSLGLDVIKRRSGLVYFKNEWKLAMLAFKIGHLNFFEWLFYVVFKLPIRLLPPQIILFIYNKFLRN